ncbi:hypothetical protein [Moraxella macacae]|uniref:hypothetical protein n=1 Tax=Moraxella macacae TaxID=765840 RepID=UPI00030FEB79|nr:hypothetical protein [Moraxella macacae]
MLKPMMLKPIFTVATLVLALTACSKASEDPKTPTAAEKPVASSPAPVESAVPSSAATSTDVASVSSATEAVASQAAPVENAQAPTAKNSVLKTDLELLFKTLDAIDKKAQAKQAELEKKMQKANSPADQQQFLKEVVAQLDSQKSTLQALKFNDKRVAQVRDKMIENINDSGNAMQLMAKNPTATPDSNPEVNKSVQKAEKSAEQVRGMLLKLVKEAGIQLPTP